MTTQSKGEKTRSQVINEARKLIIEKGFKNTSINEIIDATGVKKGALYFHFASKDELGLSVLMQAKDEFFSFIKDSLRGDTPHQKIDNFMQALLDQQKNNHFVGGCLFGNTALEMSDSNEQFARVINDVFREWVAILEDLLRQEGDIGQDEKIAPELLAKTIVATLEGGIMMARVSKDVSDLEDCIEVVSALIK